MVITGFVNRTGELRRLHDLFDTDSAELGVVYGRRLLGKTRLVKKVLEEYDDVVGLTNDETLIVGECKYQESLTDYSALSSLETHVDELRWTPPGGGERSIEYALFSRSGFRDSIRTATGERDDIRLYTIDDVVTALQS